jgi:geranylgeranyl pyrophosphate synthase
MMSALPLKLLDPDRMIIDAALEEILSGPVRGRVREAMRYAVLGAGQRIRPLLALRVARMLNSRTHAVITPAAAVEMFHCASLIVDDLPCMDNERVRRGRPCTHIEFGESSAILAAFGLVALAAKSTAHLPRFQKRLLGALDCESLIAGQSLDLTDLKTVPLFELAVQAGGAASTRFEAHEHTLMRFAREFGLAFQMVDDYLDGDLEDRQTAVRQLDSARTVARALGERAHELLELIDYIHARIPETDHCHR